MLCFFCITENRSAPSKYVTFVEGTAVCREHAIAIHQTPPPSPPPSAEAVAVVQKLKELADRVKQQRTVAATNGGGGGGQLVVDAVPIYPDTSG